MPHRLEIDHGWRAGGLRPLLLTACFTIVAFFGCAFASAFAADDVSLDVKVGVHQAYKVGCWTEARITANSLAAGDYVAFVSVLDSDGNQVDFRSAPTNVSESQNVTIRVPFRVGRIGSTIRATLVKTGDAATNSRFGGTVIAEARLASEDATELTQKQPWIVAIGEVGGIELTADFVSGLHISRAESLEDLPSDSLRWDGIDALFLPASNYETDSWNKVKNWIHIGGAAVVFPNQSAEEFLELPLTAELPVTFDGVSQVRDLSRMVSFVGEPSPLRISSLTTPRIIDSTGNVLIGGLSGPVVTVSPWGLGRLTVLTVNLNQKVFQSWEALPQLYRMLAKLPASEAEDDEQDTQGQLSQNGLTDLKTQWDAALSDFGMSTPTVWWSLGSLLLAAFLVGPLDYFLVRRVLNKPWLTWITFPTFVLLAAGWGLWQSQAQPASAEGQAAANAETLANQCTVVDYSPAVGLQRYRVFTKVMARDTGRYDISTSAETGGTEANSFLFGPAAVPESSFRGYYRPVGTQLDQTHYEIEPTAMAAEQVPIYARSTALLEATGRADAAENIVASTLYSTASSQLRGTLSHQLDAPVSDWAIAYGNLLFAVSSDNPLSTLEPGEEITFPTSGVRQKELSAYLTGRTTEVIKRSTGVGEDLLVKREAYNVFSKDLGYILPRLTFHGELGGPDYTTLTNVELTSWDLSPQLELNQAVFIGRLDRPAASVEVADTTVETIQNPTFVRILLPVAQRQQFLERLPAYEKNQQE